MSESQASKKRKHYRPEPEWRQIINDYEQSGLTQDAFCQRAGIPKSSFYKWHRRLKTSTSGNDVTSFIDLNTLTDKGKEKPSWDIELNLGNGIYLRLSSQ